MKELCLRTGYCFLRDRFDHEKVDDVCPQCDKAENGRTKFEALVIKYRQHGANNYICQQIDKMYRL